MTFVDAFKIRQVPIREVTTVKYLRGMISEDLREEEKIRIDTTEEAFG